MEILIQFVNLWQKEEMREGVSVYVCVCVCARARGIVQSTTFKFKSHDQLMMARNLKFESFFLKIHRLYALVNNLNLKAAKQSYCGI